MRFFAPMSDIAATARVSRPLWGVFWMLVTGASFVAVTALVKLVGDGIPPAQSAFLRYAMGLVLVLPMFLPVFKARLSRRALTLFGLRGAFHTFGVILWFYAMTQIPVAEVTAMNFLNPIYVTLLAAVLLGERLAIRRILAILVAFAGALVILRPGLREVGPGHIAMLFTAASFAGGYLIAKIMADEVAPTVVVGMLSLTVTIGLAPFAWAVWVEPTWAEIGWLFLVAVFATLGHYTMTLAFAAAPLAVTQPVTFVQLIWATLVGAILFDEPADLYVILGGGLIIAAISYITMREALLRRRQMTPAVSQTKL